MDTQKKSDYTVDLKKWLFAILRHWWLFIICIGIAYGVGQYYLKTSVPRYSVQAKIILKGVGASGGLSASSIISEGLGISSEEKGISNVIEIFRSRPIVEEAIRNMSGNIIYQTGDGQALVDFKAAIDLSHYQFAGDRESLIFNVEILSDNQFSFKAGADVIQKASFGQVFSNEFGEFRIEKGSNSYLKTGDSYQVRVRKPEDMVGSFQKGLAIEIIGSAGSSILRLKMIDPLPERSRAFITALIDSYNEAEVDDNVQVIRSTLIFVDERLTSLTAELDSIETEIERFKSENNIITETATGSLGFALTEIRRGTAELSEYEIENDLLNSLEEVLQNNENGLIPTNFQGIAPSLSSYIGQYNGMVIERRSLSQSVSELSPSLRQLDKRLFDMKTLIMESIISIRQDLKIPIDQRKEQVQQAQRDLKVIPFVEKQLLEKLRKQQTKESLYLFLLRKKEETELTLAISGSNTRIIEEARSTPYPVFPNRTLTKYGSMGLGIIVPLLAVILIELFKTRVTDESVVKSLTSIPVVGRIPHSKKSEDALLQADERSIRAEMFKLLRTNLNFSNLKKKEQVMVVTSSMSGEGKSITALNLAITMSLSGKKVVLVDMDLRRPMVANYLKVPNNVGVTSLLINESKLEDVVKLHSSYQNFHYITSGPIPPNPAEMIMSDETGQMIDRLKNEFDYVIIDCPPIGIVTDGLLLRNHMTNMLYLVRHRKTKKESLKVMEELNQSGELINPAIIINDIQVSKHNSSYGGYGIKSGSGYYVK